MAKTPKVGILQASIHVEWEVSGMRVGSAAPGRHVGEHDCRMLRCLHWIGLSGLCGGGVMSLAL